MYVLQTTSIMSFWSNTTWNTMGFAAENWHLWRNFINPSLCQISSGSQHAVTARKLTVILLISLLFPLPSPRLLYLIIFKYLVPFNGYVYAGHVIYVLQDRMATCFFMMSLKCEERNYRHVLRQTIRTYACVKFLSQFSAVRRPRLKSGIVNLLTRIWLISIQESIYILPYYFHKLVIWKYKWCIYVIHMDRFKASVAWLTVWCL
jgi:hypothetical protein